MLIKVDFSVLRSRPYSFLRPSFPFSNRRLNREFRSASPTCRNPSINNSRTLGTRFGVAVLETNDWAEVLCLIGSWFIKQHVEVLVPTASMPDISTRVWLSIQIVTTLLVGFRLRPSVLDLSPVSNVRRSEALFALRWTALSLGRHRLSLDLKSAPDSVSALNAVKRRFR